MNSKEKSYFLDESLTLLVKHFGDEKVREAILRVTGNPQKIVAAHKKFQLQQSDRKIKPNITTEIEGLRETDESKYLILKAFYMDLKDGKVLPESQDIRQFAQDIGLKQINGKSRLDMIPKLIRFLFNQSNDVLGNNIRNAASVSEKQRMQGFSILTDKLLDGK